MIVVVYVEVLPAETDVLMIDVMRSKV